MTEDEFWQIIETSKQKSGGKLHEQTEILISKLAVLEPEKIIGFNKIHRKLRILSYRANLWDAARLLMEFGTDDDFIDFRDWLMCEGKEVFYAAFENPDSLADVVDINATEFHYGEAAVFYSILAAYEEKTGQELPPLDFTDINYNEVLFGDFSTQQELKVRYPKLTAISQKWYGDWLDESNL